MSNTFMQGARDTVTTVVENARPAVEDFVTKARPVVNDAYARVTQDYVPQAVAALDGLKGNLADRGIDVRKYAGHASHKLATVLHSGLSVSHDLLAKAHEKAVDAHKRAVLSHDNAVDKHAAEVVKHLAEVKGAQLVPAAAVAVSAGEAIKETGKKKCKCATRRAQRKAQKEAKKMAKKAAKATKRRHPLRWLFLLALTGGAGYLLWQRSQPQEDPWAEEYWSTERPDVAEPTSIKETLENAAEAVASKAKELKEEAEN